MKFNTSVILRKDYIRKDGKASLLLRISIDNDKRKYPIDISVKPLDWDDRHKKIKSNVHNAAQINMLIDRWKNRCDEIILNMQLQGREVTFNAIHEELYGKPTNGDFGSFYKKYIQDNKSRWSPSTIKMYETELTKLLKFKSVIHFHEFKHEFILAYENYMVNVLKNKVNTIAKTFKKMKPVIYEAIRTGNIKKNPFENYKIRSEPTSRDFLTLQEVNQLHTLLPCEDKKINDVLIYFLFACYTGLRYQDIRELCWKNVTDEHYLNLSMNKTGEQITIPLTKKAITLMGERGSYEERIFKVVSNQKTNDYLKLAKVLANINKSISFHIARHTFATISLNIGIPLEVVSKLLGHNSLRTTQIYAKLLDSTKFEQMKKWDNL